ncbi:amino acid racemase [Candidatus Roizmanbacteria bacterium]|nr:MAG: amino acid racemase [Candidatus Roizmanbacteria bacterium]
MRSTNKKIGIIGGVGPQATSFIYNKIIDLSQTKYGAKNNNDFPQVIIESVPIPDFISNKKQMNIAKEMLIDTTKSLTNAGATVLCIGSNTVHLLLEDLKKETTVKFVSMLNLVAQECSSRKLKAVGLLGTSVLLKSEMYQRELTDKGIATILPTQEQFSSIDQLIRDVIAGKQNGENKQKYIAILNELYEKGAESIILGCTELPLALNYEALGDRTINSDEILAKGLVDYYYS